jgi:hypothetical protein
MDTNRKIAVAVGILYIFGTSAAILGLSLTDSTLSSPDLLTQVVAHESRIVVGALLWLSMGLALAMIPVLLYPVLREYNQPLALGYVVFRGALEPIAYILMAATRLLLILAGHEYAAADASSASYFQSLGTFMLKAHDAINPILIIVFSLGAMMLYYVLYQSRLVPRWISVWGGVAIVMHFATAFLLLFGVVGHDDMTTLMVINFPIFLQEMVMAVWLIVKGFSPAVVAPRAVSYASS